jgi:hypothetical protein
VTRIVYTPFVIGGVLWVVGIAVGLCRVVDALRQALG